MAWFLFVQYVLEGFVYKNEFLNLGMLLYIGKKLFYVTDWLDVYSTLEAA